MRLQMLGLVLALGAATAIAQPRKETPPLKTIQCIEVGGQMIPPVCDVPASRLDHHEYICQCPNGGLRVEAQVCAKGQQPPTESLALDRARAQGIKDGSLVGDKVGDRAICVAQRNGG